MMKTTAFILLASILAGCGAASDPVVDTSVDVNLVENPQQPNGPQVYDATYDYVINHILVESLSEMDQRAIVNTAGFPRAFYGFNIDGRFTPNRIYSQLPLDRGHGDWFSTIDPDQNLGTCMAGFLGGGGNCQGGVDNLLPWIVGSLSWGSEPAYNLQDEMINIINSGHKITAIRLTGVDGILGPTLNDPEINVYVYHVYPAFVNCENIQTGNQVYTVDNDSLVSPGDLTSARFHFTGKIIRGRVILNLVRNEEFPNLPLSLLPFTMSVDLPVYRGQFRFNPGEREATNGNLGGYIRQIDFITALNANTNQTLLRGEAIGPFLESFVDIPTGYPTASSESPNGGISIGMGFTMKIAQLSHATVDAAPSGVCGASINNINTDAGLARDAAIHE